MNEELFGELHEEEQYGLHGIKIEPVFDGISTAVSQYKITDDLGSIWMVGTREECDAYLYGRHNVR